MKLNDWVLFKVIIKSWNIQLFKLESSYRWTTTIQLNFDRRKRISDIIFWTAMNHNDMSHCQYVTIARRAEENIHHSIVRNSEMCIWMRYSDWPAYGSSLVPNQPPSIHPVTHWLTELATTSQFTLHCPANDRVARNMFSPIGNISGSVSVRCYQS